MARSATKYKRSASEGVILLRRVPGMMAKLAKGLKVTRVAVYQWKVIPAERVLEVERISGLPRELLRPDLFGDAARRP